MKFLEYTLPQIRQGADAPNAMDRIETFSLSGSAISNALREAPRLSPGVLPNSSGYPAETPDLHLEKANLLVQNALQRAALGQDNNLELALEVQSQAHADAVSTITQNLANLRSTGPSIGQPYDSDSGVSASASQSAAIVDGIPINTLNDLKAFYSQYAADYAKLSDYIHWFKYNFPQSCADKIAAFAEKYAQPLYINAGIDQAYVSLSLGDSFVISDTSLAKKGRYQTYSVDSGPLDILKDNAAFIDQLHTDATNANVIWAACFASAPCTPTLQQARDAVAQLEAAAKNIYHVTEPPPEGAKTSADFYTCVADRNGGYIVTPSKAFLDAVDKFKAYTREWAASGHATDYDGSARDAALEIAGAWVGEWGSPGDQSAVEQAWLTRINRDSVAYFQAIKLSDPDRVSTCIDSLIRSDAAQYGGLKTTISEAKDAIVDPYGVLVQEYMQYVQSITDLMANLSTYVNASGDGTTVSFRAAELKSAIEAKIAEFKNWSLTLPGTSALSAADWQKELSGNFNATSNSDGTTQISLDLTNLQAMSDSLKGYSDSDISVTQYNTWYTGFTGQKDSVMNLSQSIAEKFSRMNSTFDNLVKLMSSTISALMDSAKGYLQI